MHKKELETLITWKQINNDYFSDMEMSDFEKVKIFNPSNPTQLLEIYRYRDSRGNAKRGEIVPNLAKPERCPVRILDYYLEKR